MGQGQATEQGERGDLWRELFDAVDGLDSRPSRAQSTFSSSAVNSFARSPKMNFQRVIVRRAGAQEVERA